ncbi:MAG: hypothetical protein WAM73_02175, partial [Desulfobacterales bacterium]
ELTMAGVNRVRKRNGESENPCEGIFRVVMLDEAFFDIVGLAAVIAAGGLALEDVGTVFHNKKGRY